MTIAPLTAGDQQTLSAALRERIEADELALPLLPAVAAEVLASSVDDRVDAARLAELIQRDQSLTGHVLRVVNSPGLRGAVEIVALPQAIARLGMTRIREIALAASLKKALLLHGPYQWRADALWRAALAAALWSREIARVAQVNVEMAYLCGLLNDVGAPVLLGPIGELAPGLTAQALDPLLDELAPVAGDRLAGAWALPAAVRATICHRRDPAAAGPHAQLVGVAALGAALGQLQIDELLDEQAVALLPQPVMLNLYPEDVDGLLARQQVIAETLASMVV